ncbi:MAG: Uncharacterized protein XD72_2389 [Methanothrix harundinacea]|uniref:Uncharacterized protein n=1 Tax=Methanothrix harundinacea TaxID=301375 RepID=A0A101FRQ1_9EURY|nr:MAG: Uncharacterized protein XD72_2389 [Methanothrix harundinacea]
MYKSLLMVLVAFLLSVGMGLAEEMNEEEIVDDIVTVEFTGVVVDLLEPTEGLMGAPTIWAVDVSADEENDFCTEIVNVTVFQATPPPWGTFDENVTVDDSVEARSSRKAR